ncbi:flavin-containing monooxygenase [Rhodococcus opacus]|uniref:Cyclopentanone 1,2-monooxygenase n=1 Tax=Rhodococcus opacus TaxID=37919 RepID=A0A2S8J502_RHOOP|nr:NAD(P)/FAD-dependent oxidoreductase [Rhodococcus opacus]PQP22075.1 cyclopentanone 1,2-monooxygenase [Rhodococcus opacus]
MNTTLLEELDVLVIGGGFSGVYQLDRLRTLGYNVKIYEAGTGLGGVWHWNSYPGARVDTWAPVYQFSREELWRDWNWSEMYPGRDELVRYFEYVDEKLDLSKDVRYETRVLAGRFDEETHTWTLVSRNERTGEEFTTQARFVIMCLGAGSKPLFPNIPGLEKFGGDCFHTARWPLEGYDLAGKRVAVIGTGASGIQVIQEASKVADHLTVFQRTPNTALPMNQRALGEADNAEMKKTYPERFANRKNTWAGFDYDFLKENIQDLTEERRNEILEELWTNGGLQPWLGGFLNVLFDKDDNDILYAFWRDKTRQRITRPELVELLAPTEPIHPWGVKRVSLEQNYYESLCRDNVELVDTSANPIREVAGDTIVTADGTRHEVDVIVLATGFDSVTGGLTAIDIRGTRNETFEEVFRGGSRTALGKATVGFPNLLYVYGPQSPNAFCNGPTCAELEGEHLIQIVEHMRNNGYTRIEAKPEAQQYWGAHIAELTSATLFPLAKSWYMGANVPGKTVEMLMYPGGLSVYLEILEKAAAGGYQEQFELV